MIGVKGFQKGHKIDAWTGRKHSKESRLKMSLSHLGKKLSAETRKKLSEYRRGRKRGPCSEETKYKIGLSRRGKPSGRGGELHPNWKGGLSTVNHTVRRSIEYKNWREAVFSRDGWRCVWCGFKGYVEADHIKSFALYPDLRFDINNGRTLCKPCHKKTETYGKSRERQNDIQVSHTNPILRISGD